MFNNIGKKIQTLAKVVTVLGMILSVIIGICSGVIAGGAAGAISAIVVIAVGCLASWIGSFVLYGFGEIIERLKSVDENIAQLTEATKNNIISQNIGNYSQPQYGQQQYSQPTDDFNNDVFN